MKNNYCGKRVCRLEKTYVKALSAECMKNGLRMVDAKKLFVFEFSSFEENFIRIFKDFDV